MRPLPEVMAEAKRAGGTKADRGKAGAYATSAEIGNEADADMMRAIVEVALMGSHG